MKKEDIIKYLQKHSNGTVLSFPDRNNEWGDSSYRGNFSGWIPATLIYRYGANSVSEIFSGSGTTSDVCKDFGIPFCGIDLNPNPVRKDIIAGNVLEMELPASFYTADLQILHPPYPSINGIHYSNNMWIDTNNVSSADIQEMNWEDGMAAINKAILKGYMAMPKGSYQAIVVGDIRRKIDGKSTFYSMLKDLNLCGELCQILVKMQHNTVSGRDNNKYSRKLPFFLIEHEYVVIQKKNSGYEISIVCPQKYKQDIRDSVVIATWKDVVYAAMKELNSESKLETIYEQLSEHKKSKANCHYKAKIRQTLQQLQQEELVINTSRGMWKAV